MRHVVVGFGAALVLALGLVLALAGGDEDVVLDEPADTGTSTQAPPVGTTPSPPANDDQRGDETAAIEGAVFRYVAAVERGDVDAAGLPTSDELSIESVTARGDRAVVRLAGGAQLELQKEGGEWRVVRVRPGRIPAPTPPSTGLNVPNSLIRGNLGRSPCRAGPSLSFRRGLALLCAPCHCAS